MIDRKPDVSFFRAFDCFRFDSSLYPDLFPLKARSHYHSEILLVREGCCRVVRDIHLHLLHPGELIYIAPLIRHSIDSADGKPVVFDVIKFNGAQLQELPSYISDLRSIALDAAQVRLPIFMTAEEVQAYHLDNIIKECIVEYDRQEFAWDLQIRALIYLLITGVARFWLNKRILMPDRSPLSRDPVLEIPAYIEQHLSESLRVEDLAARCSLSYPWFAKRFHDYFGISCKQCIEHLRLNAVQQYLIHTDLELSEISRLTGYTDCSHMIKDFKRMTGSTPGQFRAMKKNPTRSHFFQLYPLPDPNRPPKG